MVKNWYKKFVDRSERGKGKNRGGMIGHGQMREEGKRSLVVQQSVYKGRGGGGGGTSIGGRMGRGGSRNWTTRFVS